MADFDTPLKSALARLSSAKELVAEAGGGEKAPLDGTYDDQELLDLWQTVKEECFDSRWVFERQWTRNIWYILGRQWITYQPRFGGWRDTRLAEWMPRPVTNKCKECVQAIRAMFTSIHLGVNVRPIGTDPEDVAAAATADELAPLLHEAHKMDQAMSEFDFWLLATGNAFLHTFVDYDMKHGTLFITSEQCMTCGNVYESDKLAGAQPVCPDCGGTEFQPALDEDGQPIERRQPKGMPVTMVLSPLELAFPQSYTRFDDVPYVIRSRWRTKRYFESQPSLKELAKTLTWEKSPSDHSLALFTSLSQMNDLGVTPNFWSDGSARGSAADEGLPEYEVWMKPCDAYPEGLVFRVIGDSDAKIIHLEEQEQLPGPLPYKDAGGNPVFTFTHATFEHVGGRILGSGPIDVIWQKQDQLNQLDSQVLLCLTRMGNPVWLKPKGSEIQKLTGMPGLVISYNPLTSGPGVKPERIPGIPLDGSVMALREQYLKDIEELSGTFDIMKGQKPTGVEAFSAIQALIERSQARFSSVFMSRGAAYKSWVKFALELEREFGPNERTKAVLTPARSWTFKSYQRTQLQGAFEVIVEDGSTTPKTNLGMRAAVEHASSLKMLNMQDPDQQYEGLKLFGLTRMVPTLDIHVQAALQKQQAFEEWVQDPQAVMQFQQVVQQKAMEYQQQIVQADQAALADPNVPRQPVQDPGSMLVGTPLEWLPWYNPAIHMQEFVKWANDDRVREILAANSAVKPILVTHHQEIQTALMPPMPAPGPGGAPGGGAQGMANSNQNSAPAGNTPQPMQG